MGVIFKSILAIVLVGILGCVSVIAYKMSFSGLGLGSNNSLQHVDYTNVVVILLTTVTVLFTFFAVLLGVLGIWGFNNIRIEAGKSARKRVLDEINKAFKDDGAAYLQIQNEFTNEGPLKEWVQKQIRLEVTERLPFSNLKEIEDEEDPSDEGDIS